MRSLRWPHRILIPHGDDRGQREDMKSNAVAHLNNICNDLIRRVEICMYNNVV